MISRTTDWREKPSLSAMALTVEETDNILSNSMRSDNVK
jgi:hypothetical protein